MTTEHAVAVALAVDADGPLVGVLILGDAGAGKSSLALSLIEACPFRRSALIADDVVVLDARGGGVSASAPVAIEGLIEVRGFGPAPIRRVDRAVIRVAVDLSRPSSRMPERKFYSPPGGLPPVPSFPLLWKGEESLAAHRVRRIAVSVLGGQLLQCTQDSEPNRAKDGER